MITRQLQAERRTGSVRRPKTGVLPTVILFDWRVSCSLNVKVGSKVVTVGGRRLYKCHTARSSLPYVCSARIPPGTGLICTNRELVARP